MGTAFADLYGMNASNSATQQPPNTAAPDGRNVAPSTAVGNGSPAFSWVALVGTLVAIRVLQEMAE